MPAPRHRTVAIVATTLAVFVSGAASLLAAPSVREEAAVVKNRMDKEKAQKQQEVERCFASWDAETRMTRAQFRAACTRVLGPHR